MRDGKPAASSSPLLHGTVSPPTGCSVEDLTQSFLETSAKKMHVPDYLGAVFRPIRSSFWVLTQEKDHLLLRGCICATFCTREQTRGGHRHIGDLWT